MRVLYLSISNVREAGTTRALMGGARKHKQRRTYPRFSLERAKGFSVLHAQPKKAASKEGTGYGHSLQNKGEGGRDKQFCSYRGM